MPLDEPSWTMAYHFPASDEPDGEPQAYVVRNGEKIPQDIIIVWNDDQHEPNGLILIDAGTAVPDDKIAGRDHVNINAMIFPEKFGRIVRERAAFGLPIPLALLPIQIDKDGTDK